jgi:DNA-binding CsgD family transcriptional regulator
MAAKNIQAPDDRIFALLLSGPSPADSNASLGALALLYDLTVAETRVFRMLCAGVPASRIADELKAAPSTIKTHILRIYEKTGLHRQSDLVALAGSLAPVRAPV